MLPTGVESAIGYTTRTRVSTILFLGECISFAFTIAQGIVLVPLYLHFMPTSLYGAWLATGQALGWLALADPGADMVVRQRVARAFGAGEFENIGRWIGSGLLINLSAGFAMMVFGFLLAAWIPDRFGLEPENVNALRTALRLGAVATSLMTWSLGLASPLQALQKPIPYCIAAIVGNVASIVAGVWLLFSGWGVASIPMSWLVRGLILMIGWALGLRHAWLSLSLGSLRGSAAQSREIIRLSVFTLLSRVGYLFQASSDAFLAGMLLGPVVAAKLVLTEKLIETLRTFPERFGAAAQPSLAHLFGEGDPHRSRAATRRFLRSGGVMLALLLGVGVALNKTVVTAWVGAELFAGNPFSIVFAIAAWMLTATNLGYHVLFAYGEIERPAKAFVVYGLLRFALVAVFARPAGILIFPLAAIAAAVLTFSRQVLMLTARLLRMEGGAYRLFAQLGQPFAVCLAIGVGFSQVHLTVGSRWVAVGTGAIIVLLCMMLGLALVTRDQARELSLLVVQEINHWSVAVAWSGSTRRHIRDSRRSTDPEEKADASA